MRASDQWSCDPETPLDGLAEAERNRRLVKIVEKINEAAKRDLFADIEGYDNRQRLHFVLGYIIRGDA